jgi:hypothetical protein
MTKALIKNSLAERYAKIPKEIQKKIPYYLFVKHPQRVELALLTTEYVILGRREMMIKLHKGERIAVWKCQRVV